MQKTHQKHIFKSIITNTVVVLLLLAVFTGIAFVVGNISDDGVSVRDYVTADVVYADGTTKATDSYDFGTINKGDTVTIHAKMPKKYKIPSGVLCFSIYHSVTEVYFENKLLASYGKDIDAKGDMVGLANFQIEIPDEAWDKEITIVLHATEDNAFGRIKTLSIYPSSHAYRYFLYSNLIDFVVSLTLFLCGVLILFVSFFIGKDGSSKRRSIYIALFAMLMSMWLIASDSFYSILDIERYAWTVFDFMGVYLIALPLLLYSYEAVCKKKNRIILMTVIIINLLFFVAATVLNFTNTIHYCELLNIEYIFIVVNGITVVFSFFDFDFGSVRSKKVFTSGIIVLFASALFEIMRTRITALSNMMMPSVLQLGVSVFFSCLVISFILDTIEYKSKYMHLKLNSDELNSLVNSIPTGICQIMPDDKMTIVDSNDMFFEIIGMSKEDAQEQYLTDIIRGLDENQRHLIRNHFDKIIYEGVLSGSIEMNVPCDDGITRTILANYSYDSEMTGRITVSLINITDRKRMEESLRLGEERYKLALKQSGKVFAFLDVTTKSIHLPSEMIDNFRLKKIISDMPESIIALNIIDKSCVDTYRKFYQKVYSGEPTGDTIISARLRNGSAEIKWYRLTFTSVFDMDHNPTSALITYDDITERRITELTAKWKQQNVVNITDRDFVVAEFDFTTGEFLHQRGELFSELPVFISTFEEFNKYLLDNFVYEEDKEICEKFVDRRRLMQIYSDGKTSDAIEYRSLQNGSEYRWSSLAIQMINDEYSGHVMCQCTFIDIDKQKSSQISIEHNMEELKEELENSRIKVLINQMQPHFLYNALSAIRMITKRDPNRAYDLLYDFTVHLRSSIKALSSDAPISFEDELENIRAYLNIEKMRMGDKLKVYYEIDCVDFYVIPLSIQPLAENAAKHGIFERGKTGGTINIRSYEAAEAYVVEVEDDGVGFDVNKALEENNNSFGLKNLIYRLSSLMNAKVNIQSTVGKGTLVTVVIPKEEEDNDEDDNS